VNQKENIKALDGRVAQNKEATDAPHKIQNHQQFHFTEQ